MRYRRFGRTGLDVSEVIFGGGAVGGILVGGDEATQRTAIQRALAAGINWIDTAPGYGQGKSEAAVGRLLADVDQQPHVSTKVRLDPNGLDDIPGQIEASLAASLERLRRDSVDLVQLHNTIEPKVGERAITPAHVLDAGGVADGLVAMRDQGLTRFVGMTALGDAACCRQVLDSGRFDAAQVYYNLLNPSADRPVPGAMPDAWSGQDFGGVIATCRAHGVAVMAIRVLAAGILATDTRHGRESIVTRATDVAAEEGRARGVDATLGTEYGTRAQTAIRFALANDDIAAAIIGLADVGQLDEALAAAASGPLPSAALARLEALYAANFGL